MSKYSFDYDEADMPKTGCFGNLIVTVTLLFCVPIYFIVLIGIFGTDDARSLDEFLYNQGFYETRKAFLLFILCLTLEGIYLTTYYFYGCSIYITKYHLNFKEAITFSFFVHLFVTFSTGVALFQFHEKSSFLYISQLIVGGVFFIYVGYITSILLTKTKIPFKNIRRACLFNAFCKAYFFAIIVPFHP